jgi:hypothetical protein
MRIFPDYTKKSNPMNRNNMEPPANWTENIADSTLCGYFYIFFIIFSLWAALSLIGGIWFFVSSKVSVGILVTIVFNTLISFGISATSALFLYLICERALNSAEHASHAHRKGSQNKSMSDPMM